MDHESVADPLVGYTRLQPNTKKKRKSIILVKFTNMSSMINYKSAIQTKVALPNSLFLHFQGQQY